MFRELTQGTTRPRMHRGPSSVKILELNVHGRPVYELRHYNMLAEGLIVCQSKTTTELTVRV